MAYSELLRKTDQRSKDIVSGYIRELQNSVDPDYSTPLQIQFCCLQYYLLREYFTKYGANMVINEAMDTITWIDKTKAESVRANTAYGNIVVDPENDTIYEYKWQFKMSDPRDYVYIGLDSSDKKHTNITYVNATANKCTFYGYRTGGWFDWNVGNGFQTDWHGSNLKTGDIISMVVNVKDGTIKYFINEKDLFVAPPKLLLNEKYNMAVSIYKNMKTNIQITDFDTK